MGNRSPQTPRRDCLKTLAAQNWGYQDYLINLGLKGRIVFPSEPIIPDQFGDDANNSEYHQARTSPPSVNDCGYPFAVFFPVDSADVAQFVRGVAPLQVRVTVAGGRCSHACMQDNCFVIDMRNLSRIEIDFHKERVHVGGGATIKQVDDALAGTGYAIVSGKFRRSILFIEITYLNNKAVKVS